MNKINMEDDNTLRRKLESQYWLGASHGGFIGFVIAIFFNSAMLKNLFDFDDTVHFMLSLVGLFFWCFYCWNTSKKNID